MPAVPNLDEARSVLAGDVLGPEEVAQAFGSAPAVPPVPFSREQLLAAKQAEEMLVLRAVEAGRGAPLTILTMEQRFHAAFDQKFLRKMGYQLKDEWGIALEPSAAVDTCTPGWALVRKTVLTETCNLAYEEQDACLGRYAQQRGVPNGQLRRRAAVEVVYDTVLYFAVRQHRLLERTWDWSATRTVDGGYLNVGGFGANGLQVLSFSRAVRHGALGICPTWQPRD